MSRGLGDVYKRQAENRVSDGMMFKLDFDPRIIGSRRLPDGTIKRGLGNKIRDWSIDEFPQFWNVLNGSMSLVGEWDIIGTTRENSSIYAACVA